MIPQLALANNDSLTDLSIIGVPDDQQARMPGVAGFPRKFSTDSQGVWVKMVNDPEFKSRNTGQNLDLVWHNAIREFLKRCSDSGIYAFSNGSDVTKNEFVQDYVQKARQHLVRFADECGIFKQLKIKKAYREYKRKNGGLVITSWATMNPLRFDGFEEWLQKVPSPRFLKQPDNRYMKVVQPHVKMWVRYVNKSQVTVGFDIEVAGTVNIPGRYTPTRKAVDKYMDTFIFLPTIRSHRFADVKTRLF